MKRTSLFFAILLGFPGSLQALPVQWTDAAGVVHEYEMYDIWDGLYTSQPWDYARTYVRQNLGTDWDLATITSPAEQAFVATAVVGDRVEEYWIGGYQDPLSTSAAGANWTWVTGEEWDYTNWLANEPSDTYGPGSEQHLALVNWDGTCQWNDESLVTNVYGFIAERVRPATPVPEPGTALLLALGIAGTFALRPRKD